MKAQADAQALALEKHHAHVQLQQMMRESAQHESQLQALRAETDSFRSLAEQALSRQASTAAPSIGSAAEAGVEYRLPPETQYKTRFVLKGDQTKELSPEVENNFQNLVRQTSQGLQKIVPDFIQNAWAQPQLPEYIYMAGTQTQTQVQVETERDKNVPNSASQMLAAQLTNTRSASTFACGPQEPQVSEAQGNQAGPKGPGGDDEPSDGGKSPPCLLYTSPSPRDVEESRMPSSA